MVSIGTEEKCRSKSYAGSSTKFVVAVFAIYSFNTCYVLWYIEYIWDTAHPYPEGTHVIMLVTIAYEAELPPGEELCVNAVENTASTSPLTFHTLGAHTVVQSES